MKLQISDKLYEIVFDEVKEFVIIGISNENKTYIMRQTNKPVWTEGFEVEIEYIDKLIGSKFLTDIHHAYQYIIERKKEMHEEWLKKFKSELYNNIDQFTKTMKTTIENYR